MEDYSRKLKISFLLFPIIMLIYSISLPILFSFASLEYGTSFIYSTILSIISSIILISIVLFMKLEENDWFDGKIMIVYFSVFFCAHIFSQIINAIFNPNYFKFYILVSTVIFVSIFFIILFIIFKNGKIKIVKVLENDLINRTIHSLNKHKTEIDLLGRNKKTPYGISFLIEEFKIKENIHVKKDDVNIIFYKNAIVVKGEKRSDYLKTVDVLLNEPKKVNRKIKVKCSKCNEIVSSDARFCSHCGDRFDD